MLQQLVMYVLRTTLKQCENITIDIFCRELNASENEVKELIDILHDESVIYYKYNCVCPKCKEINAVMENEKDEVTKCCICERTVDINEMLKGAEIRYCLDKDDFKEYMEENYSDIWKLANREYKRAKEGAKVVQINNKLFKKDFKVIEGEKMSEEKETKLFISHACADYDYVKCFVEFLEDIGMKKKNMFCSSIKGYGIPWGEDIYTYLVNEFSNNNLIVLFMLSDNFYKSPACLNEMGAAWVLKNEYRSVLLPKFKFKEIEGAINPRQIGIEFDNKELKYDLNEIKHQLTEFFNLDEIDSNRWDRIRDDFIDKIDRLKKGN